MKSALKIGSLVMLGMFLIIPRGLGAKPLVLAGGLAGGIISLLILALLLLLYVLPTIMASRYRHRNLTALAVANLALGWTVIGWVVCLVWALMVSERRPRTANPATDRPKTVEQSSSIPLGDHESGGSQKGVESSPAKDPLADIHFDCAKCRQTIAAPGELANQFVECPTCGETIEVPAASRLGS